ncbi:MULTISPECIES: hypothetical protein [Paenibacillus]|uniref:hypothetical protein n=1 Tax=Paenibacillus TaxID=44249 RepID=UPI001AFD5826|nr:hypothetical protein [Paenibacillus lactis]MCM3496820.1 hypothetical protein [Paenibacillus lactis]GIO93642.1 hypothetical protein J31TS3_48690 [Paenibacillus lactis]
MVKKAILCVLVFIVLLAAAYLADSASRTRYRPGSSQMMEQPGGTLEIYQSEDIRNTSSGFSPREYIKILRGMPEPSSDDTP